MKFSICVPTYNRASHLRNCLHSIIQSQEEAGFEVEVCVSNNGSTDDTDAVVRDASSRLNIRYNRNPTNLGIPRNFLKVVSMASGDFAWLLGDDDLVMPHTVTQLQRLINDHPGVDFFYVNSCHLSTDYVREFPQPFDTSNLPPEMARFSGWGRSGEMPFLELIDPRKSFDFLGGMFLSVFRRENWLRCAGSLDPDALRDSRVFSHFDNTFPHVRIFARAFARSQAFFCVEPLSVCLSGAREWAPMYPFIRTVRLPEALDIYRANGLPLVRYLWCRNFALKYAIPDMISMVLRRRMSGLEFARPFLLVAKYCLFPNFYLSALFFAGRKLAGVIRGIRGRLNASAVQA
jgi:glycosyltransferase involved in cell wall biosynthesis